MQAQINIGEFYCKTFHVTQVNLLQRDIQIRL